MIYYSNLIKGTQKIIFICYKYVTVIVFFQSFVDQYTYKYNVLILAHNKRNHNRNNKHL